MTGPVVGFVLSADDAPTLYVSGDNASVDVVRTIAERLGPIELAVLFAGGVSIPQRFDGAYLTLSADAAAQAAEVLGARAVVPCTSRVGALSPSAPRDVGCGASGAGERGGADGDHGGVDGRGGARGGRAGLRAPGAAGRLPRRPRGRREPEGLARGHHPRWPFAHASHRGHRDPDAGLAVEPDTIWRIYSMTKPITSVATMMLYEEGALSLFDPVAKFIPSFGDLRVYRKGMAAAPVTARAAEPMLVWHLLHVGADLRLPAGQRGGRSSPSASSRRWA